MAGTIADGIHNGRRNGRRSGRRLSSRRGSRAFRRGRQDDTAALGAYGAPPVEEDAAPLADYGVDANAVAPGADYGVEDYSDAALDQYAAGGDAFGDELGGSGDDNLAMLEKAVPGIPGSDYPIYSEVPETAFLCDGQVEGGKNRAIDSTHSALQIHS